MPSGSSGGGSSGASGSSGVCAGRRRVALLPAHAAAADLVEREAARRTGTVSATCCVTCGVVQTTGAVPRRRRAQLERAPSSAAPRRDGRPPGGRAAGGRRGGSPCPPSRRRTLGGEDDVGVLEPGCQEVARRRRRSAAERALPAAVRVRASGSAWSSTSARQLVAERRGDLGRVACRRVGRRRGPGRGSAGSRPRAGRGRSCRPGSRSGRRPRRPARPSARAECEQRRDRLRAARAVREPLAPEDHHRAALRRGVRGRRHAAGSAPARPARSARRPVSSRDSAASAASALRREADASSRWRRASSAGVATVSGTCVAAARLAHAQVEDRRLVDELGVEHEHGAGVVDVGHAARSGPAARATRACSGSSTPLGRESMCGEPSTSRIRRWSRKPSSFVVSPPASAAVAAPAFSSAAAASSSARSHEASRSAAAVADERLRDPLGRVDRLVAEAALVAQPAVVDLRRCRARSRAATLASSRTVNSTLHWLGQSVQTEPESSMSHGRARKR